jgi:hypothetical protein
VTSADLIVSSTHSHAAPTIMGIWGPTDPQYLEQVHDATVQALEQAARNVRPAQLWTADGSADPILAQDIEGTDHFDGWSVDPAISVLWARDPQTGATIGTYVNVPVHADQFRGSKYRMASADYPGAVRATLDTQLGGVNAIAMGTLGRQESMGGIDDYSEVVRQGRFYANAIERALATAKPLTNTTIGGAEQYIAVPAHNPALLALLYDNLAGFSCNDTIGACTIDRSVLPPYLAGNVIGTWVTTLRIGDQAWSSEPGEAFAEVSTAVRSAVGGASDVHVVGMAQDQLGYFYPPEDYPFGELNPSDFVLFNVSPTLADETVDATALNATQLGFQGTPGHPLPADQDPSAFFHAGTQLWPSVMESASPDVEFLIDGKPSLAPVLPGQAGHTASPVTFEFGDGTSTTVPAGETRITHHYAKPGSYFALASITDEQGTTRRFGRTIVVDRPPVAVATVQRAGGVDVLVASVRFGDRRAFAAHWTFSDGATADGLRVRHPAAPGATATVTVVDGAGDSATTTVPLG